VAGAFNTLYVSVTVCAPGSTSSCQTVDHVIVDTGSSGLRLVASALFGQPKLTQMTDGNNNPYAECMQFVSNYSWGSVKLADVSVGGETASSVPVQIIGDPNFSAIPSSCSTTGPAQNSVAALGAKGVLGIGLFRQDCGPACVSTAIPGTYYVCPTGGGACTSSTMALEQQVANPVATFSTDNNGVLISLPSISASGSTSVTGSLVFGIGTRSNNAVGNAQAYQVGKFGNFTTVFNGKTYLASFVDSGSNAFFFGSSLPNCTSSLGNVGSAFYCPASTQSLTATVQGANGTNGTINFSVANAGDEFTRNPGAAAFNNIGAIFPAGGFDWGLPFFFGRNVFTALEGASTPAGTGPYVAF
jgi:hypothetical protein